MQTGGVSLRSPRLFAALLFYYWLVQYVQATGYKGERGDFVYYLLIIPIALFSIFSFFRILSSRRPFNRPAGLILAFEAIVVSVALVRGDFQTIFSLGLLCTTIVVVFMVGSSPSPKLLNALFLVSIPAIIVARAVGISDYSIIPTHADAVWWRVAIFPQVATSAFFSGLIFLINIHYRQLPLGKLCLILSLYCLILSGLRSAVIATAFSFIFLMLRRRSMLGSQVSKTFYLATTMAIFIVVLLLPGILLTLSASGSPLNFFLFRSRDVVDESALVQTIFRTLLWQEHFRIAQDHWLFGVGTFDFTILSEKLGKLSSGSESFLTGMYARVGVSVLLFITGMLSAIRSGFKQDHDISMVAGIVLFVAMLAYGGFIAAYDFTFLTLMGLLAGGLKPAARLRKDSPAPSVAIQP